MGLTIRKYIYASIVIPFCFQAASAQQVLWQTLFDDGKASENRAHYSDAEKSYASALESADKLEQSDPRVLQTIRALASMYVQQGKYTQAEAMFKRALSVGENSGAQNKKETARDLDNLATVYERQEKYFQAEPAYKRSLQIWEETTGVQSSQVADGLFKLAVVYDEMGKYGMAEPLLKRALSIYRKQLNQGKIADCLDALGDFYKVQGKFIEADTLYKQSLDIRQTGFGPNSPQVAVSLTELGHLYLEQDKAESLAAFKKALSIREESLGRDDPLVAENLDDVATILISSGRLNSAQSMLQRAVAINQQTYGPLHPRVAKSMCKLAEVLKEQKNYEKSESLFREALRIDKQIYGENSTRVANDLNSLALLLLVQGKYADAEPLYKDALAAVEKTLGVKHPDVATCLNNLAFLYANQSKFTEAEPLLKQALVIRSTALGPGHPLVAQNLYNLAEVYQGEKRTAEAIALLETALKIEQQALDPDHPNLALVMVTLADLYQKQGNYAQSEILFKQLVARDKKIGATTPSVALDLEHLASLAVSQGHKDEAIALRKQSADIISKIPGFTKQNAKSHDTAVDANQNGGCPVKDKWALVVGISNFKDPSINLRYAAKDATDFRNYLINEAHFQPDHVKLLLDKQATRENIVGNLGETWLRRLANSGDMVVIYMSTHGSPAKRETSNANFIVPYEANMSNIVLTGIPMQWLTVGLKDLIHCERVIMILDVCHGGAAAPEAEKGLNRMDGVDVRAVKIGDGQLMVAASEADQLSWESRNYANGVFTRRLIEGLRTHGDKTTLPQAFESMRQKVEEEVLRDRAALQTPVLIKQWQGGDPVLGVIPTNPRPGLVLPTAKQLVKVSESKSLNSKSKKAGK